MSHKTYWAFVVGVFALLGITAWSAHAGIEDRRARAAAAASLSALQDQVKALEQRLDEQAEWSRTTDREVGIQRDRLGLVRIDLNAVMARKPPVRESTAWMTNRLDRHEQRIGNLEFNRWGAR